MRGWCARRSRARASRCWSRCPTTCIRRYATACAGRGSTELYAHQAEAWDAAAVGPFVVTTGTASGKSLCFNLTTLDVLCSDPKARALYLYPTKALAQDQARAIASLRLGRHVRPSIYDGDTKREERTAIRKRSNLILTNPDMLHMGILPNHAAWGDFFANLAVVVVDEAHVYRGVFGSHVGNVLRRLRRIASAYGTDPRFLLASATIANPVALAEGLTGLDGFAHVERDGSPGAARSIAMWNPPVTDEALQTRRSALGEAADLVTELVVKGARTICFVKSRKGVELVAKLIADQLADAHPALRDRVAPYRAGYTPQQRRELEGRLVSGDLLAVVTTDALELGIDIGALDAAVVVTFPGTVASLRQMWGRAGRRGRGLAVYVAGEDALDQFFCRHPDEFLDRPVESAIVNYENEQIHDPHLLCAAHEGPIDPDVDADVLGPRLRAHCEHLVAGGSLVERGRALHLAPSRGLPGRARLAALGFAGLLRGRRRHPGRDPRLGRRGARVLHGARRRGLPAHGALVLRERAGSSRPTRARRAVHGQLVHAAQEGDRHAHRAAAGSPRDDGRGAVVRHGQRDRDGDGLPAQAAARPRDPSTCAPWTCPRRRSRTQALWYELDPSLLERDFPLELLLGTLHAVEHSQIAVLPLLAMCDRWDIGGLSTNLHPQTGGPTIFIYDGHPGGVGITQQGFLGFERLVADAYRLISECKCKSGLPVVRAVAQVRQSERAAGQGRRG